MIFRFGKFQLDTDRGELTSEGAPVVVQPKPLALLELLITHRDRIVPIREITDTLWPDSIVTPSSLTRAASHARRAIGDTHKGGVIKSYPRRGYRFCEDVLEVGAARHPREARPTRGAGVDRARPPEAGLGAGAGTPFIGRADALAKLRTAWAAAVDGRGGLVLVEGRPGIGKTRLVEVFREEVAGQGGLAMSGYAREGEGVPAYWIWEQILRQLLREPLLADAVSTFVERSRELVGLLPELGAPEPPRGEAHHVDQSRFLFFDASARVLARCAKRRPLLIVLDDLQWAGPGSMRMLEHLALECTHHAVLLVATLRDEVRERGHPLGRVLALAQKDGCEKIELAGFSRGEVAHLLRQIVGPSVPSDLTSELYARTEGVPLFLREALRVLEERGELAHPETIRRHGLVLPDAVLDLIGRALDGLSAEAAALVGAAAVLGREFGIRLVANVGEVDPARALDLLDEAVRAGAIEPIANDVAQYRFTHALHREAAYAALSPATRTRLHQRAARCLETQHAGDLERVIAELAHHHHRGIAVGDPERAYTCAMHAAERARRLFAYEQAVTHYTQALDALDESSSVDPARRLQVLLELGTSHRLAGDRERRIEVLGAAMEAARAQSDTRAFARAAIEYCDISEWSHEDAVAEAALHESLAGLDAGEDVLRARLLTRLAYLAQRDRARSLPFAREAVDLARKGNDPYALQDALYMLGYALAGPDHLDERGRLGDEMLDVVARSRGTAPAVIALVDGACDRIALGDAAGAAKRREQASRVAGETPGAVMIWHMRVYDAGLALLRGELDRALELAEDAGAFGRRIDHPYATGCYLAHAMLVARERGEHARALDIASKFGGPDAVHLWIYGIVGRAHLRLGQRDEAERVWKLASENGFADVPFGIRFTSSMLEVAHLCADLEDERLAPALLDRLAPLEHHHGVLPVPICYGGPVAHALARLHELAGRRDDALSLYAQAWESSRDLGARPAQARVGFDFADALRDRRRSEAIRAEARDIARALGLGDTGALDEEDEHPMARRIADA